MVFVSEQWLLVSLLAVLVSAFFIVETKRGGQSLSYHELTRLVNSGDGIVLDVREPADFKAGHIVDAINIPHQKLSERMEELEKHKAKTLVVVDKMGQHAGSASKMLKEKGFSVSRLQGGMSEWQGQNLPVVRA